MLAPSRTSTRRSGWARSARSARSADPRIARVQTAEAYFYLGELALLRVDVAEARRRFDAVVDLVGKDVALKRLSAYAGAMAELRRLPR